MKRNIEMAKDGDRSAAEALVASLRPRITKMAGYYARCSGMDADDLLQEAWIGLLEALPQLDMSIGTPEQYLIRCARWRLLDALKRERRRRHSPLDDDMDDLFPAISAQVAVAEVCASEFTGQLKSSQRAVLDCLLDGLTWREAGAALGCTSANIAYHVRTIRRRYEEWSGGVRE